MHVQTTHVIQCNHNDFPVVLLWTQCYLSSLFLRRSAQAHQFFDSSFPRESSASDGQRTNKHDVTDCSRTHSPTVGHKFVYRLNFSTHSIVYTEDNKVFVYYLFSVNSFYLLMK